MPIEHSYFAGVRAASTSLESALSALVHTVRVHPRRLMRWLTNTSSVLEPAPPIAEGDAAPDAGAAAADADEQFDADEQPDANDNPS